ncbi:MAG: WYL domain-containing protein [Syntrophaceae bacterium]
MAPKQDSGKTVAKRLFRLARILKLLVEHESVSTDRLCRSLGITPRTIQRDLKALRAAGFPIHEQSRGLHRLDKSLLKHLDVYDEADLALIVAIKDLTTNLGQPFTRAAEHVFNRLNDFTDERPVIVKIEKPVWLSRPLMNTIIKAIQTTRCVAFTYTTHPATVEPYRIAYFDGLWYLVGRDTHEKIIKKYALDKIADLKILRRPFKGVPATIDEALEHSTNIWFSFSRSLEVLVEIDNRFAGYFERRRILPRQETVEKRQDGTMVVRFMACTLEEISVCLKPWLPHVRIITPEAARERLLGEIKAWIAWQSSS